MGAFRAAVAMPYSTYPRACSRSRISASASASSCTSPTTAAATWALSYRGGRADSAAAASASAGNRPSKAVRDRQPELVQHQRRDVENRQRRRDGRRAGYPGPPRRRCRRAGACRWAAPPAHGPPATTGSRSGRRRPARASSRARGRVYGRAKSSSRVHDARDDRLAGVRVSAPRSSSPASRSRKLAYSCAAHAVGVLGVGHHDVDAVAARHRRERTRALSSRAGRRAAPAD